jgi:hypothetical protein
MLIRQVKSVDKSRPLLAAEFDGTCESLRLIGMAFSINVIHDMKFPAIGPFNGNSSEDFLVSRKRGPMAEHFPVYKGDWVILNQVTGALTVADKEEMESDYIDLGAYVAGS